MAQRASSSWHGTAGRTSSRGTLEAKQTLAGSVKDGSGDRLLRNHLDACQGKALSFVPGLSLGHLIDNLR